MRSQDTVTVRNGNVLEEDLFCSLVQVPAERILGRSHYLAYDSCDWREPRRLVYPFE